MATPPTPAPQQKPCFKCRHVNASQAFCGECGSPLSLDEFVTSRVNSRLSEAIRDRDVLETESAINVFEKALGWMKLLFLVATVALAIVGVVVGYKTWDFSKVADNERQSVTDAANKSRDDISKVSSQSKQGVSTALDAAKRDINVASENAIKQSRSIESTVSQARTEISKNTASFRTDLASSREQLRAASELQPQMEGLQNKLAQTNADVEAQKKVLSSSQDFVRSIFGTHRADVFFGLPGAKGAPAGRYAILPSPTDTERQSCCCY